MNETKFTMFTAPLSSSAQLTANKKAWIESITVKSGGHCAAHHTGKNLGASGLSRRGRGVEHTENSPFADSKS